MNRLGGVKRRIDIPTFGIYLGLIAIGWLMIYTVGYGENGYNLDTFFSTSAGKQTMWVGVSLATFFFVQLIDTRIWQTFAYPIYAFSLFLLLAVLLFGANIKGATSWFRFGGITIQPSELAKVGTCLAMAAFLSHFNTHIEKIRYQLLAAAILAGPMFLILMQPDAGSALVFTSFLVVLYRAGLQPSYYVLGAFSTAMLILGFLYPPVYILQTIIALGIIRLAFFYWTKKRIAAISIALVAALLIAHIEFPEYLWYIFGGSSLIFIALSVLSWQKRGQREVTLFAYALILGGILSAGSNFMYNNLLKPHQQDRINVWLRPELVDEQGAAYNLINSKMAIGSGGLQGKGFLNGYITKGKFVPEQETDFIFSTIGEEQGFIGSFFTIGLFLFLILRISFFAERQRTDFAKYYAYSFAGILFIHFFVNISMTIGLMPIIGIPLPFVSKGGSSLLGFTIMLAIMLKLDTER